MHVMERLGQQSIEPLLDSSRQVRVDLRLAAADGLGTVLVDAVVNTTP